MIGNYAPPLPPRPPCPHTVTRYDVSIDAMLCQARHRVQYRHTPGVWHGLPEWSTPYDPLDYPGSVIAVRVPKRFAPPEST